MSLAVSIRIATLSAAAVPGQLRHDLRTGVLPDYVDRDRVADNRVLVEPPSPARMRERTVERRARASPRRALRRDAAIAVAGIVTWSREAQELIRAAPPDRQDAAYRAIAEAVGRHYGIGVLGLTVHVDESAPHAHVWWDARCEDGSALSASLNTAHLQDLAAGALAPLFPQIGRGRAKRERRAAGEPRAAWVHRSVRELHQDLPAEIEALERERDRARDRAAEMAARVSALETREAELGALTERERRRLTVYEKRLETRRQDLEAVERRGAALTAALDGIRAGRLRPAPRPGEWIRRDQAVPGPSGTDPLDVTWSPADWRVVSGVWSAVVRTARAETEAKRTRAEAEDVLEAARLEAEADAKRIRADADRDRAAAAHSIQSAKAQAAVLAEGTASATAVIGSGVRLPEPTPGQWRNGPAAGWAERDPFKGHIARIEAVRSWPAAVWSGLCSLAQGVMKALTAAAEIHKQAQADRAQAEADRARAREQLAQAAELQAVIADRLGIPTVDPNEIAEAVADLDTADPRPAPDDGPAPGM